MKIKSSTLHLKVFPLAIFILLLAAPFVPGQPGPSAAEKPPQTNRMKPGYAPTPFSAAEIRAGCPRDRTIVFQVEMSGQAVLYRTITFVTVNPEEAVIETVTKGADGKRIGSKQMVTARWEDLQAHASFPDSRTEIRTGTCTTPAGTFDCWLYVVTMEKDGKKNVQDYRFAKSLPGPPVSLEETVDGKPAYRMTMLKTGR